MMTEEAAPIEVVHPSVVENLERAAVDVQVSTAHRFPRYIQKFKDRAMGAVMGDVETAESCIYKRPVGDGKIAEGGSIRLAEIVASSFGNLRVQSRVIEQTDRFVKCEGVAHDLESNYAAKSEVIEPTVKKDGSPYSERQRAVVAKVALAKAFRDAVFKVVPKAYWKVLIDAAKKVVSGDAKTLAERRDKVIKWVTGLRIDEKRVFAVLGIAGWADLGIDHLETLTGLKTAIADNETTIDEAFPPIINEKSPDFSRTQPDPVPDAENTSGGLFSDVKKKEKKDKPKDSKVETTLEFLLKKMADAGIVEAQMLNYCREIGLFDESLNSLAEIFEISPDSINQAVKNWNSISHRIKATPPPQ